MNHSGYRRHPRIYKKHESKNIEKSIDLSIGAAVGILTVTFIKGIVLGCIINRKLLK